MTDASLRYPVLAAALDPIMVRRRRALRIAPPEGFAELEAIRDAMALAAPAPARDWLDDLRFFVGCYAAGLVFFLVILS